MPTSQTGRVSAGSYPDKRISKVAVHVAFSTPFPANEPAPLVHIMLSALDADHDRNIRLRTQVIDVTRAGFQLKMETWSDTILWNAQFSWLATNRVEKCRNGILQFESIGQGASGGLKQTTRVHFVPPFPEGIDPASIPVSCALIGLDVAHEHHCRLALDVTNVSREGFDVTASTWNDSFVYGSLVSWFCSTSDMFRFDSVWRANYGDLPHFDCKEGFEYAFSPDHATQSGLGHSTWASSRAANLRAVCGFTSLDNDGTINMRLVSRPVGPVSPSACKLEVKTWAESQLYGTRISTIVCKDCFGSDADLVAHVAVQPAGLELPTDYEYESTISDRGWFGQCYSVRNRHDGQLYCIKHFTRDRHSHEHAAMIATELRNLYRLPLHPNIVRYHHSTVHHDQLFIVTELIQGCCIAKMMPSPARPLDRALLREIMRQVFDGMAHLHAGRLIHRDIHMGNIMVSYARPHATDIDRGPHSAKIIDFGWAKAMATGEAVSVQSVGRFSLRYHSPERLLPANTFGEKDDVWALGVILAELLTGRSIETDARFGPGGNLFAISGYEHRVEEKLQEAIQADAGLGNIAASILRVRDPAARPTAAQICHQLGLPRV